MKNIAKALLQFNKEVDTIKKDSKNPFFKSNYASLPNILEAIQKPLQNSGLVVTQIPNGLDELKTILIHAESGEVIEGSFNMHIIKNDPQALGSAITYARRYALGAMLNLNIDEDDDGNKAMPTPQKRQNPMVDLNKDWLNPNTPTWTEAVKFLKGGGKLELVTGKYNISKANKEQLLNQSL